MARVVNTETQAAASRIASMNLSLRARAALALANCARRASPVGGAAFTAGSEVVMAVIVGSCCRRQEKTAGRADASPAVSPCVYIAASRLSSSSMVMPTSFLPPNTVPFLPLAMCSRLAL